MSSPDDDTGYYKQNGYYKQKQAMPLICTDAAVPTLSTNIVFCRYIVFKDLAMGPTGI